MFTRKSITTLGIFVALGAPLAAFADNFWVQTNDEAGWQIVAPTFGAPYKSTAPTDVKPLTPGAVSTDSQYVWLGEQGGWQLRPMQYRFQNGRLVHVDDPVGHMERHADSRPLTAQQRATLERSGGS
jgi:hypothetical protein